MTYRVIGEDESFVIQRKDSRDGFWFLVSKTYPDVTTALADMNTMADEKRAELAAMAAQEHVHGEVTV